MIKHLINPTIYTTDLAFTNTKIYVADLPLTRRLARVLTSSRGAHVKILLQRLQQLTLPNAWRRPQRLLLLTHTTRSYTTIFVASRPLCLWRGVSSTHRLQRITVLNAEWLKRMVQAHYFSRQNLLILRRVQLLQLTTLRASINNAWTWPTLSQNFTFQKFSLSLTTTSPLATHSHKRIATPQPRFTLYLGRSMILFPNIRLYITYFIKE